MENGRRAWEKNFLKSGRRKSKSLAFSLSGKFKFTIQQKKRKAPLKSIILSKENPRHSAVLAGL